MLLVMVMFDLQKKRERIIVPIHLLEDDTFDGYLAMSQNMSKP
jgi:hypothetical protein